MQKTLKNKSKHPMNVDIIKLSVETGGLLLFVFLYFEVVFEKKNILNLNQGSWQQEEWKSDS